MGIIFAFAVPVLLGVMIESLINKVGADSPTFGDFLLVASAVIGFAILGLAFYNILNDHSDRKGGGLFLFLVAGGFLLGGGEPRFRAEAAEEEARRKAAEESWWSKISSFWD